MSHSVNTQHLSRHAAFLGRAPFSSRIGKVCALLAAALVLPVLAHAGTDNGNGNGGHNDGNQNGHDKVVTVPDAGPGIALLAATIGTILLVTVGRSQIKRDDLQSR